MVNKVILAGNLVRDAESITGSRGAVTRMRLATSSHWRDADGNHRESTEYHNLVAFNRLAEICGLYCFKGRRIYTEGRLRTRDYDGPDGLRRTTTEVVLDVMRLLDRREESGGVAPGTEDPLGAAALHDEAAPDEAQSAAMAAEAEPALAGASR